MPLPNQNFETRDNYKRSAVIKVGRNIVLRISSNDGSNEYGTLVWYGEGSIAGFGREEIKKEKEGDAE